jgi:hypothetical protein
MEVDLTEPEMNLNKQIDELILLLKFSSNLLQQAYGKEVYASVEVRTI